MSFDLLGLLDGPPDIVSSLQEDLLVDITENMPQLVLVPQRVTNSDVISQTNIQDLHFLHENPKSSSGWTKTEPNPGTTAPSTVIATALGSRTTEQLIEDLKRPLKKTQVPPVQEPVHHMASNSSAGLTKPDVESPLVKMGSSHLNTNVQNLHIEENETGENEEEEEEEEDETPNSLSAKERRRRTLALVNAHVQTRAKQEISAEFKARSTNVDCKSAKWLVDQAGARHIISSPRDYQVELFERAKTKNIIAVLDTGSGKTLIAALLLRHIYAQELENRAQGRPKRMSFFIVDSVTLLHQQHAVLKANLDQQIDLICGAMGCDLWSKEQWDKIFDTNSLIVCTAEILYQCLMRSFISITDTNLLIFDEAHHAKKNHPYARIIKDFYLHEKDKSVLPKIFGMTASPVDARVDVKLAAAELEGLLQCEIATAADTSLLQSSNARARPDVLVNYASLGRKFKTPLVEKLQSLLGDNEVFRKPLAFSEAASRELGSWCADQIWKLCFSEKEAIKLSARTELKHLAKAAKEPLHVLEAKKQRLREAEEVVKCHSFELPNFDLNITSNQNLSSKVQVLVDCLKMRFSTSSADKCIVFVKQRYTALLLGELFGQETNVIPNLRVGILVGTKSGETGDMKASFRQQVITMIQFRKGVINCLFATSIAEEGLDIPDCNLVIRFDLYTTLIQYIQSRGRARHADSKYVHMFEEKNIEHGRIIREVRANEHVLKKFCAELPEDRKLTGNDYNIDFFLSKEKTHRVYKILETGAKLTYRTSLGVLSKFVDSMPHSGSMKYTPDYVVTMPGGKLYVCEVILPEGSPIRGAVGQAHSTKQVAKCSAAFETCLLLRKGKYLDEWLLPVFSKQLPAMRNAQLAVDSKKRESYAMRTKPDMWSLNSIPEELFVTIIFLTDPDTLGRASQPLGLLTRGPIKEVPRFLLHFGGGRHSAIKCVSLSAIVPVDKTFLKQITTFTLCIFDDVFSKAYEPDEAQMPYFLVPVGSGVQVSENSDPFKVIEWGVLKQLEDYQTKWQDNWWEYKHWEVEPEEFYRDRFIVDPWDGARKFWSKGITHEYKPLDPVPPDTAPRSSKRKADNITEYSCSLWSKARARREFSETQPVLEAELISLRRNLLDEFDAPEDKTPKKCFIVTEPLKLSPLPSTVVAMAYLFPAIIHRIESCLIALDACSLLHLDIAPELALEAITKDSDNTEDHGDEQVKFQRGMGKNYERLEFLGDCFLKMATSISLFGAHPSNDEYHYHVDRMLLICNKNLRNNAVALKLYEYIRSQSFNRRAWYPEGLVLKRGKTATAPKSHKLGDKTIADVSEALIGAAFLSTQGEHPMDMAVRAVTELVCSDNHKVAAYSDYYKMYQMPEYQTAQATAAQKELARLLETKHVYHFQYPRLARSAFVHPSYPFVYEHIPSYQRLEFLGDSLLDMVCVTYLFENFPTRDPQWLTEHKMAMVSNQFLGALCVSLEFHRHLLIFNSTFQGNITDYVAEVTEARLQAEEEAMAKGKPAQDCARDYWLRAKHPPKCLPDVVEAYIGAIFVDSEYNFSEVQRFFDEHIKWYFEDMTTYDTFANKHPTTFLTSVLSQDMRCSKWSIDAMEIPGEDGRKARVMAVVTIHDNVIADATAESSRYAKVNAAKAAFSKLEGLQLDEFRMKWLCNCTHDDGVDGDEDEDASDEAAGKATGRG